jgi:hypothetical protein
LHEEAFGILLTIVTPVMTSIFRDRRQSVALSTRGTFASVWAQPGKSQNRRQPPTASTEQPGKQSNGSNAPSEGGRVYGAALGIVEARRFLTITDEADPLELLHVAAAEVL